MWNGVFSTGENEYSEVFRFSDSTEKTIQSIKFFSVDKITPDTPLKVHIKKIVFSTKDDNVEAAIIKASNAVISQEIPSDYSVDKSDVSNGQYTGISYYSEVTDSFRNADVFLPAGYDEDKSYPVLYMLHGIGAGGYRYGDGNGSLARMVRNAIDSGICPEMIVIAPDMRCSNLEEKDDVSDADLGVTALKTHSQENYDCYDLFVDDIRTGLMPVVSKYYSVKTGRKNTAIAGFSMGGRESLYIGFSHPELFGYIGAFCPAFGIFEYYNDDVRMGEDGLFDTTADFTLPDKYKDNTFIEIVK